MRFPTFSPTRFSDLSPRNRYFFILFRSRLNTFAISFLRTTKPQSSLNVPSIPEPCAYNTAQNRLLPFFTMHCSQHLRYSLQTPDMTAKVQNSEKIFHFIRKKPSQRLTCDLFLAQSGPGYIFSNNQWFSFPFLPISIRTILRFVFLVTLLFPKFLLFFLSIRLLNLNYSIMLLYLSGVICFYTVILTLVA